MAIRVADHSQVRILACLRKIRGLGAQELVSGESFSRCSGCSIGNLCTQSPIANFKYPKFIGGDWVRFVRRLIRL